MTPHLPSLTLLLLLAAQIPLVESRDFSRETQQAATVATVRLVNKEQKSEGSGVIVRQSGPFVYVLTAFHVVDRADSLELTTFSAKSYPKPDKVFAQAQVIARAKEPDLALLRLTTRETVPAALRICPPDQAPRGKDFAVLTVGCVDGKAPVGSADKVKDKLRARRPSGEVSTVWEMQGDTVAGRSGGPLVDGRGFVLGVGSGRSNGKAYYVHLDEIYTFVKQNGWQSLLEADKER